MDIVLAAVDLSRRQSTRVALKVLEAAIEQAFGYPVQVQKLQIWMSPLLFEEGRIPERMTRLGADSLPELLPPEVLAVLDSPTPPEQISSAKEMIRRRRERPKKA